jgi:hypothetical protein
MTKVLPLFELRIGATVERGNVNAKAELFFFSVMKREGKKTCSQYFDFRTRVVYVPINMSRNYLQS